MQLALPLPPDDASASAPAPLPAPVPVPLPGIGDWRADLRMRWAAGDAEGSGRALAAMLPPAERARWAAAVLALLAPLGSHAAGVDAALALAHDESRWAEAHDLALALGRRARRATDVRAALHGLAECVAQLAYAAAGGLAPFDEGAAGRVAAIARALVERAADPALEGRVWRALSAHVHGAS